MTITVKNINLPRDINADPRGISKNAEETLLRKEGVDPRRAR